MKEEIRFENIRRRNEKIIAGDCSAYYIDENILRKLEGIFEEPSAYENMIPYDNCPPYSPER